MTTTYTAKQIATAWRTLAESHRREAAAKVSSDPQGALTYYAKAQQLEDCARDLAERLAAAPALGAKDEAAECPTHGPTTVAGVHPFQGYAGGRCYLTTLACGCSDMDESGDLEAAR
jgi:hypothetical protein